MPRKGPALTADEKAALTMLLKKHRESGEAFKGWDICLAAGAVREQMVKDLLMQATLEIKSDFKASQTGRLVVEEECWGKPSGITTSTADWWCFVLSGDGHDDELAIFVKTDRLREIIKDCKYVMGGDGKASKLRLVPFEKLLAAATEEAE